PRGQVRNIAEHNLHDEILRSEIHRGDGGGQRRPSAQRGGWGWRGGALPGPVSSGELPNAKNQNLVAGQEWPLRSRFSVVPGGELPPSPPPPNISTNNPTQKS